MSTDASPRTSVVVIDDHAMFRAGVIASLADRVTVLGEAEDVDAAVAMVIEVTPEVALLDVHLPSGNGADVILGVQEAVPGHPTRFLGLSVSDAPADVMGLVRAGAQGYVTKRVDGEELHEAIVHVATGNAVFSPRLAAYVLDAFRDKAPPQEHVPGADPGVAATNAARPPGPGTDPASGLTAREREVMQLLARGFTYKEIAAELYISDRTVESHTSSVLRKLQLTNRNELAHWAARNRLL